MLAFLFHPNTLNAMQLITVENGMLRLQHDSELRIQKFNFMYNLLHINNEGRHTVAMYFKAF